MADARIHIEGTIASEPRYNSVNGAPVANVRVLAGRSRKNDDGSWEDLSTTAYDVAYWREHAQLADSLRPEKGSKVIVTGTVTGVESYQGQNGESLSVKVNGDGLRVFPKRDQQGNQQQSYGPPQGQQQSQQGGWGQPQDHQPAWDSPQSPEAPF